MSVSRRTMMVLIVLSALVVGCGAEATPRVVIATPTVQSTTNTDGTWVRSYGGDHNTGYRDMILTDDNGFFITGTTNQEYEPTIRGDAYLIRMNSAGDILWQRTYGEGMNTLGQSVAQTDDGGLVVVGMTNASGNMDAFVVRVDQEGNEVWSQPYGGPLDEWPRGQQVTDGGYILWGNIVDPDDFVTDPGAAGYAGHEGRSSIYALGLDADGNELWSRTVDIGENVLVRGGLGTPDGGFLVLANIVYFPEPGDDIYLVKFDADGNVVWERIWEESHTAGYDIIPTSDGNYLIAGAIAPPEDEEAREDFLFIKVDPEGIEIWSSTFGDPDMIDYGVSLTQTSDGGFATVGARRRDNRGGHADVLLVKIDSNGQLEWEQVIPANFWPRSVLQHPDGGFVIAGYSYGETGSSTVLIKTDAEGNVSE